MRFTPTGEGTTGPSNCQFCVCTVHPHGRGDNFTKPGDAVWDCGSPPRAWGQQAVGRCHDRAVRFTPTGVGTTFSITLM